MKAAGFFRRICSLLYDTLIITGIIFSSTLLLVWLNKGPIMPGSILSFFQFLVILLTGPIFYCYFWVRNKGQSIGMQAWKIRLVNLDEEGVSLKQSFLRCIFSTADFVVIGLGYISILFDQNNRSTSDKLSSTKIVKIV